MSDELMPFSELRGGEGIDWPVILTWNGAMTHCFSLRLQPTDRQDEDLSYRVQISRRNGTILLESIMRPGGELWGPAMYAAQDEDRDGLVVTVSRLTS